MNPKKQANKNRALEQGVAPFRRRPRCPLTPPPQRGATLENKPSSQVATRSGRRAMHQCDTPSGASLSLRATHSLTLGSCPTHQLQVQLTPSQAQPASAQRCIKNCKGTLRPTPHLVEARPHGAHSDSPSPPAPLKNSSWTHLAKPLKTIPNCNGALRRGHESG